MEGSSLAVILYGEASSERTIVIANAVQEPQDFVIYSQGSPNQEIPIIINGTPVIPTQVVPTIIPTTLETVITTTRTMTNTLADLTVSVGDCNSASKIGDLRPANNKTKYYICQITVTAEADTIGTSYSQETFNITDKEQIENTIDWIAPPLITISDALGNGRLTRGDSKTGRIVGLIKSNNPVLVWQQAGKRFIIELE